MIILSETTQIIHLPKLERCKLDECNLYYLLLHNNYTKELWVFKVRDFNSNPIRFNIYLEIPECFDEGEYTYYLVSVDDWNTDKLSTNYPTQTQFQTDKEAITTNGMYIISNNKMLVTSKFKAKLLIDGKEIKDASHLLTAFGESDDEREEGEIVKEVNVLNTGLLKYHLNQKICCNNFINYEGGEHEKYIQYNG